MNSLRSGYRLFCKPWWKHWFSPSTYWYWAKYKIQRANRGWADCDTWGLDGYLASWMPAALKHLKDSLHGVPSDMFTAEEYEFVHEDGCQYPPKDAMDRAEKKWDGILDSIISGFEAYKRMQDSPSSYEKEIGEYPMGDFSGNSWKPHPDYRAWSDKEKPLLERDKKLWENGAALFIQYFGNLWD